MRVTPASTEDMGNLPVEFAFERASPFGMSYNGTVGDVLQTLTENASDTNTVPLDEGFWYPSLALRGVVDGTLNVDLIPHRFGLINVAAQFALRAYAGSAQASDVHELGAAVAEADQYRVNVKSLNEMHLKQWGDGQTATATGAQYSLESANRLLTDYDEEILMIAICHGGFPAAAQTFLMLERERQKSGYTGQDWLYPARFSSKKHGDIYLQITHEEVEALGVFAVGKLIVVHDEDAHSGTTIQAAVDDMSTWFPGNEVIGITNYDAREAEAKMSQGVWFNNYPQ
jgi:hypothetical protein